MPHSFRGWTVHDYEGRGGGLAGRPDTKSETHLKQRGFSLGPHREMCAFSVFIQDNSHPALSAAGLGLVWLSEKLNEATHFVVIQ